jgi:uncharacterized protein
MTTDVNVRVAGLDWPILTAQLQAKGFATTKRLLSDAETTALASCYEEAALFRNRVVMARHGFGQGEYKYFNYPLPSLIDELRECLYPQLFELANTWHQAMGLETRSEPPFPPQLAQMLASCQAAGQSKPTPLLLKYGAGDYNCLHQDLYGEHVFPLQVAFLLSTPGVDFEGGEFVLVEQRPRMQSRAHVVPLQRGEAVIFAVNQRPVQGTRGSYRVKMRHGVSEIRSGQRFTAGIIFHDAL